MNKTKEEKEAKKAADAARKAENAKLLVRHLLLPTPRVFLLYTWYIYW